MFTGTYYPASYFAPTYWPGTGSARADIREAVVAALRADAALSALVGSRVYFGSIAEDRMPGVVVELDSNRREHALDGPTGVARATFTFWGISKVLTEDADIAEAIRQRFDGFAGYLTAGGGRIRIRDTILADETDRWSPPADATSRGVFETPVTFAFEYDEPRPARLDAGV